MTPNFSVNWRNPGHWDIYDSKRRIFCIRGVPGDYYIRDERTHGPNPSRTQYPTVDSAMAWICATLMWEQPKEGTEP